MLLADNSKARYDATNVWLELYDVTLDLAGGPYTDISDLATDVTHGNGVNTLVFEPNEYVILADDTQAYYYPPGATGHWLEGAMPDVSGSSGTPQVLSYMPYSVYSFFQNGGRFTWIVRAVSTEAGKGGTEATATLHRTSPVEPDEAHTTDTACFTLTATSVGLWGNGISYNLITQNTTQHIFALQVLLDNSDGIPEVVETFTGLSMTGAVAGTRRVDTAVNDLASGSRYVRVTNVHSNNVTPDPDLADLTGGTDPDIPNVTDLSAAVDYLDEVEGPMNINVCTYLADASLVDVNGSQTQYVSVNLDPRTVFPEREDVIAFNDGAPPKDSNQSATNYATSLTTGNLVLVNNSYAASYAPWLLIPHPTHIGQIVAIPPAGAVMGVCARIDATIGVHRAPAGVIAGVANAVGVQAKFSDTELGTLNAAHINIIRSVIGSGICIMGARTRKTYGADRYLSARRVLINLKEQLRRSTQYAIFENNDERLWSSLRVTAENVLRPMWDQGGLRGVTEDQAFYVKCDEELNTLSVIASGEVRMEIGVALEYPAEFIIIKLTQITGTQVSEIPTV